jgi:hypothetical protein
LICNNAAKWRGMAMFGLGNDIYIPPSLRAQDQSIT